MHGDPEATRHRQLGRAGADEGDSGPPGPARGRYGARGGAARRRAAADHARPGGGGAAEPRSGVDEGISGDLPGPRQVSAEPRWLSKTAILLLHAESLAAF